MVYLLNTLIKNSELNSAEAILQNNEEYTPFSDLASEQKLSGNRLIHFAKTYEVYESKDRVQNTQHLICSQYSLLVSRQAMDVLESFEKGIHQFIPVQVLCGNSEIQNFYEDLEYFYLNVCRRIDAVDIRNSVLKSQLIGEGTSAETISYRLNAENMNEIYIDGKKVLGRHIWRGDNYRLANELFVSNQLNEAWESLGQQLASISCLTM